jgi:hypothetical protein
MHMKLTNVTKIRGKKDRKQKKIEKHRKYTIKRREGAGM